MCGSVRSCGLEASEGGELLSVSGKRFGDMNQSGRSTGGSVRLCGNLALGMLRCSDEAKRAHPEQRWEKRYLAPVSRRSPSPS